MKYLIVQDWDSTHGNHAGMVHMCKLLCEKYPEDYRMFVKDCPPNLPKRSNPIIVRLMKPYDKYQYRKNYTKDYLRISEPMFDRLERNDKVFLLEYNCLPQSQYELACYIKKNFSGVKICALSHLTPSKLKNNIRGNRRLLKWDKPIDVHLTLGKSLSDYFVSIGIPKEKISTGFHYVDNEYYHHSSTKNAKGLTIITMGALQRDFGMLADIVKNTNSVNWIICRGNKKEVDDLFPHTPNVILKGYMAEDELRNEMAKANVSLSVLEDTVGSNVITTSMAMGLAIIVSDVGSIRDYCDETNAKFCENTVSSFVNAIRELSNKSILELSQMSTSSKEKAEKLSINRVHDWFCSI